MEFKTNFPLSELTTFRIGGNGEFLVAIKNEAEVQEAREFAKSKNLAILVFGGGSNILVSDKGFSGLVVCNKIKGLTIDDSGLVTIGTGENWDDVVKFAVEKGFSGIECLSGVPGSAGGAVVQNIGAYGQTISDSVVKVFAIEWASGQEKVFQPDECEFEYRGSTFKKNPNKFIVTKFQLKLHFDGSPSIAYPHVKKHFEGKVKPTLSEVREFIIKLRASKGYLNMDGYERFNTAGSFFKNPVVPVDQYEKLKSFLGDPSLNRFWETPKGVKLAAAYLMEQAGFSKGYREGNVGISPKHSLSLVNFGGATAKEVKDLSQKIREVVHSKFGVNLEEEVLYIGEI